MLRFFFFAGRGRLTVQLVPSLPLHIYIYNIKDVFDYSDLGVLGFGVRVFDFCFLGFAFWVLGLGFQPLGGF